MAKELSKEELLDKIEETASKYEKEIGFVGRCVLKTLMEYFDLGDKSSKDLCLKSIMPLCAGIAGTRNTCGGLLGGLMAIGMVFFPGREEDADFETIQSAMALGRQYYRRFEKEVGNTRCFDIRQVGLGRMFDTADPEEYDKFKKAGGYDLCSRVSGKAARLAAEFILKIQEEREKG